MSKALIQKIHSLVASGNLTGALEKSLILCSNLELNDEKFRSIAAISCAFHIFDKKINHGFLAINDETFSYVIRTANGLLLIINSIECDMI